MSQAPLQVAVLVGAVLVSPLGLAQAQEAPPQGPPPGTSAERPPRAPAPKPETGRPEAPWRIDDPLLRDLAHEADVYKDYALRFTCLENVRLAKYDESGEASDESTRRYAYLLEREPEGETLREFRQKVREDGTPRGDEVKDEEPFPPAYAWVELFSRFNQPYFAYRDLGDRFDGFDWVREIQFKGALPFSDGKDIRQWEGTVLVDAVTATPLSITAQPTAQDQRVKALFDRWSRGFNFMGMHLAPRPFLYHCEVEFRLRKDGLTFPTELRYDTLRATSPKATVPWQASTRTYEDYRFFKTATTEKPGSTVPR